MSNISWSPDGTQIAFLSNRINAAGNNDSQVWVINLDGTGLRQVGIGKPGHDRPVDAAGLTRTAPAAKEPGLRVRVPVCAPRFDRPESPSTAGPICRRTSASYGRT